MIYTLTLNPSIDYVAYIPDFKEGDMNIIEDSHLYAGGKGINVSRVLFNLGVPSVLLGFTAGFTGDYIRESLLAEGLNVELVQCESGYSRINFKMKGKSETECNGKGPEIQPASIERLYAQIESLQPGDVLVLSGSLPVSIKHNIYKDLIEKLQEKEVAFYLDGRGKLVTDCLPYKPYFLKPNIEELGEMFQVLIRDEDQCIFYGKELQRRGAANVLISMGKEGAILCAEDGNVYRRMAPTGLLKNSTGSGDSMVAGFIASMINAPCQYERALHLAVAAGSATAFNDDLASREEIMRVFKEMDNEDCDCEE